MIISIVLVPAKKFNFPAFFAQNFLNISKLFYILVFISTKPISTKPDYQKFKKFFQGVLQIHLLVWAKFIYLLQQKQPPLPLHSLRGWLSLESVRKPGVHRFHKEIVLFEPQLLISTTMKVLHYYEKRRKCTSCEASQSRDSTQTCLFASQRWYFRSNSFHQGVSKSLIFDATFDVSSIKLPSLIFKKHRNGLLSNSPFI